MNLALYREFRPTTFEQVIGQKHITKTLANQVKNNNLTHAYLFTGARGTGKTTCARIFSKALNCLTPNNGSPCGVCENCKALNEVNTDILEIDAASNNRVDEIRDLRERVKYPPVIGRKKVYIIDEVHMLTESAFNALLKTLEEPPEYVVFILGTTEVHKLPATILSRCTRFDFRLLTVEELAQHLKNVLNLRGVSIDNESLYTIARLGEGSVRDMLSIADSVMAFCEKEITIDKTLEVLGLSSTMAVTNIIKAIGENDVNGLFSSIKEALSHGKNLTVLCKEMTEYFKNLLLLSQGIEDFNLLNIMPSDLNSYKEVVKLFNVNQLKAGFEKLSRIELDLKFSLNPENLIESTCVNIMMLKSEEVKPLQPVHAVEIKPTQPIQKIEEKPVVEQNINQDIEKDEIRPTSNELEVGKIWGNVLIKVKEKNMFAFYSYIKNVYGVKAEDDKLILHINDKTVFETIDTVDKKSVILSILKELNFKFSEIEIIYDETNKSKNDVIKSLKDTFLDKLKIKE